MSNKIDFDQAVLCLHNLSEQLTHQKIAKYEELSELFVRMEYSPKQAPRLTLEKRGFFQWFRRLFKPRDYRLQAGSQTAKVLQQMRKVLLNKSEADCQGAIHRHKLKTNPRALQKTIQKIDWLLERIRQKKVRFQRSSTTKVNALFESFKLPLFVQRNSPQQLSSASLPKRAETPLDMLWVILEELRTLIGDFKIASMRDMAKPLYTEWLQESSQFYETAIRYQANITSKFTSMKIYESSDQKKYQENFNALLVAFSLLQSNIQNLILSFAGKYASTSVQRELLRNMKPLPPRIFDEMVRLLKMESNSEDIKPMKEQLDQFSNQMNR